MSIHPPESISQDFASASAMLHRDLLEMTVSVCGQLEDAIESLLHRDGRLAEGALELHQRLVDAERDVDLKGLDILVNFKFSEPRLRMVLGTMQISRKVRRISDHTADIARRSKELLEMPESYDTNLVEPVYNIIVAMLSEVTASLADHDAKPAGSLEDANGKLLELIEGSLARLSVSAALSNARVDRVLNLAFVINALRGISCLIGEILVDLNSAQLGWEGAA